MSARWLDLVDPTREELLATLPVQVDPDVVEALAARPADGREPRPLLESHGAYVFGVLVAALPAPRRGSRRRTRRSTSSRRPSVVVTVRKTPRDGGEPFDVAALHAGGRAGRRRRASSSTASSTSRASRSSSPSTPSYAEIDELEDAIDDMAVRARYGGGSRSFATSSSTARRTIAATRAAVRRVLDGRVDVGEHALFPPDVERLFADTYETLVRATEELDIARDLLAGVRDHHQSKVVESQNEVGEEADGHRVARARSDAHRRVLRPELRVRVRRRVLVARRLDRPHRRVDARPARDLPLAPLDLSSMTGAAEPLDVDLDAWDAWTPAEAARQLEGLEAPWYVTAGWALDLFLGRQTREHDDLEIGVPSDRFAEVRDALADFELVVVGDGKAWPLDRSDRSRRITRPGCATEPRGPWRMDVFREPWDGDVWICRRDAADPTSGVEAHLAHE